MEQKGEVNNMRLIDADALKEKAFSDPDTTMSGEALVYVQDIDEAPTIDAVPVVWCEDCKHTREKTAYEAVYLKPECLICEHPEVSEDGWAVVSPEHFCSYGKQKEDNT